MSPPRKKEETNTMHIIYTYIYTHIKYHLKHKGGCHLPPPQTLHIMFSSSSPKILPSSPGYIFSTRPSISPPRPLSPLDRSAATQLLECDR